MIELELTAVQKHVPQFRPTSLDARFCPRQRQILLLGDLLLCQTIDFGHHHCLAVGFRERLNHRHEAARDLPPCLIGRFGFYGGKCFRNFLRRLLGSVVVDYCVARYLIDPAADFVYVSEGINSGMDSHKDVLEDVIGSGCVADTAFNKAVELAVIVVP